MEYKLPDMDRFLIHHVTPGNWVDMKAQELMRQYAEQAVDPLLAEIERLKRGEFICNRCGLRKNADTPEANF